MFSDAGLGLVGDWTAIKGWKGAAGVSRLLELAGKANVQVNKRCLMLKGLDAPMQPTSSFGHARTAGQQVAV